MHDEWHASAPDYSKLYQGFQGGHPQKYAERGLAMTLTTCEGAIAIALEDAIQLANMIDD